MEKEIEKEITVKETTHQFYCDKCGKYLGESNEYRDGWYDKLGYLEISFYNRLFSPHGTYCIRKNFCEKCKDNFINQLSNSLESLGFINEKS